MLQSLSKVKPKNFRERLDKAITKTLIGTNHKLRLDLTPIRKQTGDIYYNTKTGYSSNNELQRRSGLEKCERLSATSTNTHRT